MSLAVAASVVFVVGLLLETPDDEDVVFVFIGDSVFTGCEGFDTVVEIEAVGWLEVAVDALGGVGAFFSRSDSTGAF